MTTNLHTPVVKNEESKTIGSAKMPIKTFTKEEFLTKRFLAAKFKESAELIEKTLKEMAFRHVTFSLNGHATPVVVKAGQTRLRVHPMAMDVFTEYLEKQKAKA